MQENVVDSFALCSQSAACRSELGSGYGLKCTHRAHAIVSRSIQHVYDNKYGQFECALFSCAVSTSNRSTVAPLLLLCHTTPSASQGRYGEREVQLSNTIHNRVCADFAVHNPCTKLIFPQISRRLSNISFDCINKYISNFTSPGPPPADYHHPTQAHDSAGEHAMCNVRAGANACLFDAVM